MQTRSQFIVHKQLLVTECQSTDYSNINSRKLLQEFPLKLFLKNEVLKLLKMLFFENVS